MITVVLSGSKADIGKALAIVAVVITIVAAIRVAAIAIVIIAIAGIAQTEIIHAPGQTNACADQQHRL